MIFRLLINISIYFFLFLHFWLRDKLDVCCYRNELIDRNVLFHRGNDPYVLFCLLFGFVFHLRKWSSKDRIFQLNFRFQFFVGKSKDSMLLVLLFTISFLLRLWLCPMKNLYYFRFTYFFKDKALYLKRFY